MMPGTEGVMRIERRHIPVKYVPVDPKPSHRFGRYIGGLDPSFPFRSLLCGHNPYDTIAAMPPTSTSDRDRDLIAFYQKGNSLAKTGEKFGLTKEGVSYILKRNNTQPRPRVVKAEPQPKKTPIERFWEQVDKSGGPDACWLWTGTALKSGYAQIAIDGTRWYVHNLAYFLTYGMKASAWNVRRCGKRLCCNAAHMYDGTPKDTGRHRTERWLAGRAEQKTLD